MKASALGLLLLLAAASLAQQPESARREVPEEAMCTIEGNVFKVSGEPLRKAWVRLHPSDGFEFAMSTLTDASGYFSLKGIPPGGYRLFVERRGYIGQEYGQSRMEAPGRVLSLAPGTKLRELVFKLLPAAVIAGRVYDEDGEPLEGAQVEILQYGYSQGRRILLTAAAGSTNDLGEYRLSGLAPGRYSVRVTIPEELFGYGSVPKLPGTEVSPDQNYPPIYYPGTADPARAGTLQLQAGDELGGVDIALRQAPAYRIRGRVTNAVTGGPSRNTQVFLTAREEGWSHFGRQIGSATSDSDGVFEIRSVLPGAFRLHAAANDGETQYAGVVSVDVGAADVEGISVAVAPGIEIPGVIRLASGEIPFSRVQPYLDAQDDNLMGGASSAVNEDGGFKFSGVTEGRYECQVASLPDGYYLKSVRFGRQDVLENGLVIERGTPEAKLEIVISAAGATIEGQVTDSSGLPFGGASVVLIPNGARRNRPYFFRETIADPVGRFKLHGVPPGDYKLFAWEAIEPGIYGDEGFLRLHESKGKALHVAESSTQVIELKVIPANPLGS